MLNSTRSLQEVSVVRVLVQLDEARETVRRSRAEVLGAAVSEGSADLSSQGSQAIDKHSVEGAIGALAELCDFAVDVSQPLSLLRCNLPRELLTLDARCIA